ncbi:uncharacterized protein LACBIDRAFT_294621 [Laccaria bicolor S238N-H82]|uniref:Predicted protein n=1 Tax=Laccaria bicolor (strain S238N-H82 / ATCC MYA-4686) TaxID=486041 RepID=B0DFH3_LACBS|nr:uncharacterized protein LACBIDRAFT_294621 [Laccaria bicolor S238N-H82]EDR06863.1 predicted protein [Laccaria bicolor S238N-H82]|eukprot:XP_001882710.1 predicted protein [Laccaria bicolor S238N-H82]
MANNRMTYLGSVFIVFFLLMAQLTFAEPIRVMRRDAMMNAPSKRDLPGPNANIGRDLKTNAARMAAGFPPLAPRYPSPTQGMFGSQWLGLKADCLLTYCSPPSSQTIWQGWWTPSSGIDPKFELAIDIHRLS